VAHRPIAEGPLSRTGEHSEGIMERIYKRACTAEQSGLLTRNVWRYARVGQTHIRICESTEAVPVVPRGPAQHDATIEILDAEPNGSERAEEEAVAVVAAVFGDVLGGRAAQDTPADRPRD
jgi:hypothetical protein